MYTFSEFLYISGLIYIFSLYEYAQTGKFVLLSGTLEFIEEFRKKPEPLVDLDLPIALLCASIPIVHSKKRIGDPIL